MSKTIYVYKYKDDAFDVFEAETEAELNEDGSFIPVKYRQFGNMVSVKYTKCLVNGSGKGITQYDKKCTWIIHKPEFVYRNLMWLPEYNINKAISIFGYYYIQRIHELDELISNLHKSEEKLNKSLALCDHKNPDGTSALQKNSQGNFTCPICGEYFYEKDIINNKEGE